MLDERAAVGPAGVREHVELGGKERQLAADDDDEAGAVETGIGAALVLKAHAEPAARGGGHR